MTVTTLTSKVQYACNGTTTVFPYTFLVYDEEDLEVILTDTAGLDTTLALTTDYTVSGEGEAAGGSVTCLTAPVSGKTLTIARELELKQGVDFRRNQRFDEETIEQLFDEMVMMCQQLDEALDRAAKLPVSTTLSDLELPAPVGGQAIGWNAGGTALANIASTGSLSVSTFGQALVNAASSCSARTLLDAAEKSVIELEHGAAGGHTRLPRQSQVTWTSGDVIAVGAGCYRYQGKLVYWDDFTYQLTSAGDNADSDNLGGEEFQYLYIDWDKASGYTELSASCFLATSASPTSSAAAMAMMNGSDLCVFALPIESSAVAEFWHGGGALVHLADFLATNLNSTDVDTAWTDCALKVPAFGDGTEALVHFRETWVDTANNLYWRKNGSSATDGQIICWVATNSRYSIEITPVVCDANGKIEVKNQVAGGETVTVYTAGFFLRPWMCG